MCDLKQWPLLSRLQAVILKQKCRLFVYSLIFQNTNEESSLYGKVGVGAATVRRKATLQNSQLRVESLVIKFGKQALYFVLKDILETSIKNISRLTSRNCYSYMTQTLLSRKNRKKMQIVS